jgi:hypothetical protein
MNKNDTQKRYNYQRIRVNKDDDLAWVRNVINDLWREDKMATYEGIWLIDSLSLEDGRIE